MTPLIFEELCCKWGLVRIPKPRKLGELERPPTYFVWLPWPPQDSNKENR